MLFFILFSICTAFSPVSAHGYVSAVTIDGVPYKGSSPYRSPAPSPIRWVDDIGPITNVSDPSLACGPGAQTAAMVAPATPGSEVAFQWVNGGGANWGHNVGPLLTYMASCGNVTCDRFDAADARWFKIAQVGKEADGTWSMAKLNHGEPARATVPADLAPGDYLIRIELIALQGAQSPGGAEFFPSCTQIRVGGSGKGVPAETETLPGAYGASDPGLLVDVYTNPKAPYSFPGPPVATLVAAPQPVPSSGATTSVTRCLRPRQVSRVMARMAD